MAAVLALVFGVPDQTDILLVSRNKNERLAALGSPKIVLIGGSNLAFGVDSAQIAAATACPIVNMGLNGLLGTRYLLAESAAHLSMGDVAVISFEYDVFFMTDDGLSDALFGVMKANPSTLRYMTWEQRLRVVRTAPYIAQRKVIRLMQEVEATVFNFIAGRTVRPDYYPLTEENAVVATVETLSGFNELGDVVSHLDTPFPWRAFDGYNLSGLELDEASVDDIIDFVHEMEARGVAVLVSFTPTARDYYEAHRDSIEAVYERLDAAVSSSIVSTPRDFLYDRSEFFDTVYHLRRPARADRTARLIRDLNAREGGLGDCPGPDAG